MNILVVMTERKLQMIELYLRMSQYSVYKFIPAREHRLYWQQIDLAILISCFRWWVQIPADREYTFPVIMLTAGRWVEYMDRRVMPGADDYIPKPFNPLNWWPGKGSPRRYQSKLAPKKKEEIIDFGAQPNRPHARMRLYECRLRYAVIEYSRFLVARTGEGDQFGGTFWKSMAWKILQEQQ